MNVYVRVSQQGMQFSWEKVADMRWQKCTFFVGATKAALDDQMGSRVNRSS